MNRKIAGVETVLLMADEGNVHISSTMIRTLGKYQTRLENFVPKKIEDEVYQYLFKKLKD